VSKLGLSNRITILQGDLLAADLRSATWSPCTCSPSRTTAEADSAEVPAAGCARGVARFQYPGLEAGAGGKVEVSGRFTRFTVYQMPPVKD